MERAGDNRYSDSDSTTRPEPGSRSRTLVTDGRPAGTHYRDNAWFDGGPGARGSRAHELARYNGTSFEPQSENDAPFMRGDRARTADGTLREVRADQLVSNNPTLVARAPEVVAAYGDKTVGELRELTGMSLSQFAALTSAQRAAVLQSGPPVSPLRINIDAALPSTPPADTPAPETPSIYVPSRPFQPAASLSAKKYVRAMLDHFSAYSNDTRAYPSSLPSSANPTLLYVLGQTEMNGVMTALNALPDARARDVLVELARRVRSGPDGHRSGRVFIEPNALSALEQLATRLGVQESFRGDPTRPNRWVDTT
jgi:hypothetical protein